MQKLRLPAPHPVGGGPWYLLESVGFKGSEPLVSPSGSCRWMGTAYPTPPQPTSAPSPGI